MEPASESTSPLHAKMYIDGELVIPVLGNVQEVINPSTEEARDDVAMALFVHAREARMHQHICFMCVCQACTHMQ